MAADVFRPVTCAIPAPFKILDPLSFFWDYFPIPFFFIEQSTKTRKRIKRPFRVYKQQGKDMKLANAAAWIVMAATIFFLSACGGGGSSGGTTASSGGSGGTGKLSLGLVDAPGGDYQAVYVTIGEVQVCRATGSCDLDDPGDCDCQWESLATLGGTYNLLELVDGVMATLVDSEELPTGTYNQMRLMLDDQQDDSLNIFGKPHPHPQYLIDEGGDVHPMKVPSGYETGIKLVHPFDIVEGRTTELLLDFDVADSVVKAGNSGKYLLKPTIKIIDTDYREVVSDVVTTDGDEPLAGASVSAWHVDSEGSWSMAMRTLTDSEGGYRLYLDSGWDEGAESETYKIVATADAYDPGCQIVEVHTDQTVADTDFALPLAADTVTVSGIITGKAPQIEGEKSYPSEAPVVKISFSRLIADCAFDNSYDYPVETASVRVQADGNSEDVTYDSSDGSFSYSYSIQVPVAEYTITATSEGLQTPEPISLDADNLIADVNFEF